MSLGGEGGEIPKGGRAGRGEIPRDLAPRGGEIPRDLAPGGGEIPGDLAPGGARSRGGGAKSLGHRVKTNPGCVYTTLFQTNPVEPGSVCTV